MDKFVITGEPFKQVFSPYIGSDVPVFITTDSLLNGFHVLLEESIYRMELANARKFGGHGNDIDGPVDSLRRSAFWHCLDPQVTAG